VLKTNQILLFQSFRLKTRLYVLPLFRTLHEQATGQTDTFLICLFHLSKRSPDLLLPCSTTACAKSRSASASANAKIRKFLRVAMHLAIFAATPIRLYVTDTCIERLSDMVRRNLRKEWTVQRSVERRIKTQGPLNVISLTPRCLLFSKHCTTTVALMNALFPSGVFA